MPKDNEIILDPDDGPTDTAPLRSFAPDEMVRCESCLRANPPIRMACLYCGQPLPVLPTAVPLQKPALRPLEKWEQGYNNILLPCAANAGVPVKEIADFVRLTEEEVLRIVTAGTAMPLARSASVEEAKLIQQRLQGMGLSNLIVADQELAADASVKLRAIQFLGDGFNAYQSQQTPGRKILWHDVVLLVSARIMRSRVEVTEERKRNESRVLEADQFFDDEKIFEFYTRESGAPYRIMSGSFDFSCLGGNKRLIAAENISVLVDVFLQQVPGIVHDQTFNSVRKGLDPVWRADQHNESTGWRRGRPGKYSLGSITESSNESQFSRYSRLRYYLLTHDSTTGANV